MSTGPRSWPRVAPAAFDDTSRLIPGRYAREAEHVLDQLATHAAVRDLLVRLAGATNGRLQAQEERHPRGLGRADVVFGVPYSKVTNGAFAFPGEGARFHDRLGRGAWYCATDLDTCVAEVAHHRIRHLRETGAPDEDGVQYREFLADVHGQDFAWLDDGSRRSNGCLDPESYAQSQALGHTLISHSRGGVVYPSVRRRGGTCIAVLQPSLVGNVRSAAQVVLTISDYRLTTVAIER